MSHDDRRRIGPHKKSASIEVRVSQEEKDSFLLACRRAGRSASDIIRDRMAQFARQPQTRRLRLMFASTSLALIALIGALNFQTPDADPVPAGATDSQTVQVAVNIVDADGFLVEERVLGARATVSTTDLLPDAEIVNETRSLSGGREMVSLTVRLPEPGPAQ